MRIGIYLSYVGLGANLLHLSYCHQIAKKYGPVSIITLCKNLEETLEDDPLIENVYYIDKFQKRLTDIYKLSNIIKELNFNKLLVFYPSIRIYLSAKLAGIKEVYIYNILKKKNLHIVYAAKKLTENEAAYVDETDFSRIRSHVQNEVEEEKEEKYKQLEFEFDEDLVSPI